MINWKFPVGFAVFGAVVSLLAGIIGGNPFGVIVLRLILSAVICTGLGLGVSFVVRRFLSEHATADSDAEVKSGEAVDIVIDEDIPMTEAAADQEVIESVEPQVSETSGAVLQEEMVEASEMVEATDTAEATDAFEPAESIGLEEEDVLPFEDADTPDESIERGSPDVAAAPVTDFEDLDTLPDIDQFSPAAEESSTIPRASKANSQVEEVVRDQDPESLARAVRTFMKKDQ